ncbi:MAG: GT4 family glycosyltransferase PelF [Candidatus Riflebacteria bacterium]|nr:GT4 family glycosyltransferase PelF [Candidatus Riflebacteria bacterium]
MSKKHQLAELPEADVELILEGSYPYITGGVSTWVHRLIENIPNIRFGLTFLGAHQLPEKKLKYKLPANVMFLQNIYLYDTAFPPLKNTNSREFDDLQIFSEIKRLHSRQGCCEMSDFENLLSGLSSRSIIPQLRNLFYTRESFALLVEKYQGKNTTVSFSDYFWTWRFMHLPVIKLLAARRPKTRMVHVVSTGFAGFLASLRHIIDKVPVLLTEHGIYTRERTIEIQQAKWIYEEPFADDSVRKLKGFFKNVWLSFFHALGKWTYQNSDKIITLFKGNQNLQISLGADVEKTEVIPNGINLSQFRGRRNEVPPDMNSLKVAFVGRVVPIKDVKTLLRAAKIVIRKNPGTTLLIIGPVDEEEEYFKEVQSLNEILGISQSVRFLGKQNVSAFFPKIDIIVLTSLSEAQPLILLEAMAACIPCVATDVGSCRELLYGRTAEDQSIGKCGLITPLRYPEKTAEAILEICSNPVQYLEMAHAGRQRIERYYQETDVFNRYHQVYSEMMSWKIA